jgi:hypothetical protein
LNVGLGENPQRMNLRLGKKDDVNEKEAVTVNFDEEGIEELKKEGIKDGDFFTIQVKASLDFDDLFQCIDVVWKTEAPASSIMVTTSSLPTITTTQGDVSTSVVSEKTTTIETKTSSTIASTITTMGSSTTTSAAADYAAATRIKKEADGYSGVLSSSFAHQWITVSLAAASLCFM